VTQTPPSSSQPPQANLGKGNALQRAAAAFWLSHLFWGVRYCTWYPRITKGFWIASIWFFSAKLRETTITNARRLAGPGSTLRQQKRIARATIANFFQFILDLGKSRHMTAEQLRDEVGRTIGEEHYHRARAMGRGIIIATAHFGSFEIGIAALQGYCRDIHVLFRRDPFANFEAVRQETRKRLGAIEHNVDDGLSVWIQLRQALQQEHVVLIQADRAEPGQPGKRVPFFDGHIMVPTGPMRLAAITGAPVLPVFCYRAHDGRVNVRIEPPILVPSTDAQAVDAAVMQYVGHLEQQVRQYPDQWLMLQPVWLEDQEPDNTAAARDTRTDSSTQPTDRA
jgi:lauroyl/myristoyl acyltransferase